MPSLGENSFFVSDCNREAHAWLSRWPEWMSYGFVLTGPEGSGKTHLAHIWRNRAKAQMLAPSHLNADFFAPEMLGPAPRIVVDGAEAVPDARALFHLLNWVREQGGFVLLTARAAAPAWPLALPDLRSRLAALPAATVQAPDDAALKAVLVKHLADRQLSAPPPVVEYLARHMERSYLRAGQLAALLDETSLSENREITLPLARKVLGNL
jgi:chromosomal replication initiation ATPase DnaA